jgi:ribosome biogenesis protein ERB1
MATSTMNGTTRKRKKDEDETPAKAQVPAVATLDVDSDGEDTSDEDDGEMHDFPELDTGDSETSSDSKDSEDAEQSEDGLKKSPKPGDLVVSSITGRLKRIYPDIEPEYDSDSSTEDVRVFRHSSGSILTYIE